MKATAYEVEPTLRPLRPGSWTMVLEAWRGGGDAALRKMFAGLLPHGRASTRSLQRMIDRRVPAWPVAPRLWLAATDYRNGDRRAFTRADSKLASVGAAVAASCPIPGFYRPVRIGGRLYVDGGVTSSANLELVAGEELDLVICMLPLTPVTVVVRRTPFGRFPQPPAAHVAAADGGGAGVDASAADRARGVGGGPRGLQLHEPLADAGGGAGGG